MKVYRKIMLFALVCAGAIGMQAQGTSALRLSLTEAQNYALEHNYSLQNAALEVRKAEATRWQTLSTMLPQVKAGFDYQNMCGYEMNLGGRNSMSSMLPDSQACVLANANAALISSSVAAR